MAVIDVHNLTSRRLWCSSHCLACPPRAGSGEGGITYARTVCRRAPPRAGTNPLNKNLGDKVPRSPAAAPRSTRTLPLTRGLRWVALPTVYDDMGYVCTWQGAE